MMEIALLLVISSLLIACIAAGLTPLYGIVAGLAMLVAYSAVFLVREARAENGSAKHDTGIFSIAVASKVSSEIARMMLSGLKSVSPVLLMLLLVGIMSAFWRASGTVSYLVSIALDFCNPSFLLLASFLICCAMSVVMGTAFGTAITVGIVCMILCMGAGLHPAMAGGAILAGVYFGDRWSPISTCCLLVAQVTGTDPYRNLARMVKPSVVPFLLSCALFAVLGLNGDGGVDIPSMQATIRGGFSFSWALALPALAIVALSLFRMPFYVSVVVSTLCAFGLMLFVQDYSGDAAQILRLAAFGFTPESEALAALVSGGGFLQMTTVMGIIAASSCYAGIFERTGFLQRIQGLLAQLAERTSWYIGVTCASILANIFACNQTLGIVMTRQLSEEILDDSVARRPRQIDEGAPGPEWRRRTCTKEELALAMEDTVVPIAALVPWSTACILPLTIIVAPLSSVLFASYLYLLPLCGILCSFIRPRILPRVRTTWAKSKSGR